MNTSNNRRYRETEQRIKDAFFNLLDSEKMEHISVQDICHTARISRPTFYTHYEDINDMIMKIEQDKAETIYAILRSRTIPSVKIFEKYFDYLKENRSFYTEYLCSGENALISQSLMDTYLKENQDYYAGLGVNEESIKYLMIFFAAGLKAIALRWLKGGCKEPSAEMAELIHKAYFQE